MSNETTREERHTATASGIPQAQILRGVYEVIVVGAGHAGCEAALPARAWDAKRC